MLSFASKFSFSIGTTHWRVMGFEGLVRLLSQNWEIYLHVDFHTIELCGCLWLAPKRNGFVLMC